MSKNIAITVGLAVVYVGVIVFVFAKFGTPFDAKAREFDKKRLGDLEAISYQVQAYSQTNKYLPLSLADASRGQTIRVDPESKKPYDYVVSSATSYQLCATFSSDNSAAIGSTTTYMSPLMKNHKNGYDCIKYEIRVIPPPLPPVSTKKAFTLHSQPLIGYWSFDDDFGAVLRDSSGNLVDGVVFGLKGESWKKGSDCYKKGCVEFDGVASFADMGNPDIYQLDKSITISAWIYPENITTGSQLIFGSGQPGTSGGYKLYLGPKNSLVLWTQEYQVTSLPSTKLVNGKWYHVVSTIDSTGKVGTLYLDGKREASGGLSVTPAYGPVTMAKDPASSTQYFKGRLDEVRLYNKALTQDEVSKLYISP